MRSIEANYKKIQARNTSLGAYPCLVQAVRNRNFSRKSLVKAFKKLMPKEEYAKNETKGLLGHLELLTNTLEEGEIWGKNASGTAK